MDEDRVGMAGGWFDANESWEVMDARRAWRCALRCARANEDSATDADEDWPDGDRGGLRMG